MTPRTVSLAVSLTSGYPRASSPQPSLADAMNRSYRRFSRWRSASSRDSRARSVQPGKPLVFHAVASQLLHPHVVHDPHIPRRPV